MSELEVPVRKTARLDSKEVTPMIFFENVQQQAVWECILKDEIDGGFWSKVKFEKNRYLLGKTFVLPAKAGISFPPALMSFYFDNLDFIQENGYFVAVVMKLAEAYTLSMDEMKMLATHVESFVMVDFKDDNSNYRRIQVGLLTVNQRNIPDEYRQTLKDTETYFKNKGIDMEDVVNVLKDNPPSVKEVRKIMRDISEVVKRKVDISDLLEKAKSLK